MTPVAAVVAQATSTSTLLLAAIPLLVLVALVYLAMWRGWVRRAQRHDLPELVPVPSKDDVPPARLEADARYFGTTVSGSWLDRVVARGLGARSTAHLSLSMEGLDVVRRAGAFRIPAKALRGARHDQGIAGKVVPPHGLLIVTWQHGNYLLDSGFRLTDASASTSPTREVRHDRSVKEAHKAWIRSISTMAKEHSE